MKIEIYDTMPEEARQIRQQVFIEEQGFSREFDETDKQAWHLVLYEGQMPAGTCRLFPGEEPHLFILGRIAVQKVCRGKGFGAALVAEAERFAIARGGTVLAIHAQCRRTGFYEKLGFLAYGPVEDDQGCPHIWMKKQMGNGDETKSRRTTV